MNLQLRTASLFLVVVFWGTLLGGIAYEHLVFLPVYLSALPDSSVLVNGVYGLRNAAFWQTYSSASDRFARFDARSELEIESAAKADRRERNRLRAGARGNGSLLCAGADAISKQSEFDRLARRMVRARAALVKIELDSWRGAVYGNSASARRFNETGWRAESLGRDVSPLRIPAAIDYQRENSAGVLFILKLFAVRLEQARVNEARQTRDE